jgi:hypothetical protein
MCEPRLPLCSGFLVQVSLDPEDFLHTIAHTYKFSRNQSHALNHHHSHLGQIRDVSCKVQTEKHSHEYTADVYVIWIVSKLHKKSLFFFFFFGLRQCFCVLNCYMGSSITDNNFSAIFANWKRNFGRASLVLRMLTQPNWSPYYTKGWWALSSHLGIPIAGQPIASRWQTTLTFLPVLQMQSHW